MSVDIIITERNDYRGRWAAFLYEGRDLDGWIESILRKLTGYGETPLAAAANLLAYAESERKRREP